VRSRLFHSIVGVAIAVVPSGCSEHELVARPVSVVADSAATEPDTSVDTTPNESDAADTALETEVPEDSADTSDAGSETFSDAPTDADANDGWAPTK